MSGKLACSVLSNSQRMRLVRAASEISVSSLLVISGVLLLVEGTLAGPVVGTTSGVEHIAAPQGEGEQPTPLVRSEGKDPGFVPLIQPPANAASASAPAQAPVGANAALAAELLREAGIGTAASAADANAPPSQRLVRTPAAPAHSASGIKNPDSAGRGVSDDPEPLEELRDFGKAAVHWLKDAIPWLKSESADSFKPIGTGPLEWSGAPAGVTAPSRAGQAPLASGTETQTGAMEQASVGRYDEHSRKEAIQAERNVIREAVQMLRNVLQHPMTWLVVSLFIVGGIAMSVADRRPK